MHILFFILALVACCQSLRCNTTNQGCGQNCIQQAVSIENQKAFPQIYTAQIGVIDVALNAQHDLLKGQLDPEIDSGFSCNETACIPYPILSFNDSTVWCNHGTSVVSVLIGRAPTSFDSGYNGCLTKYAFSYYNVSTCDEYCQCSGGSTAFQALQAAAQALSLRIISLSMSSSGSGPIVDNLIKAASNVFDSGKLLIESAGNYGPSYGTMGKPANAPKTIAVGAVYLPDLEQYTEQSRGPGLNGTIKPDVQGVGYMCAAGGPYNDSMQLFGGTSSSAPTVAASAALLYAKIAADLNQPPITQSYINGMVAAFLFMSGNNSQVCNNNWKINNLLGFGLISLPNIQTLSVDYDVATALTGASRISQLFDYSKIPAYSPVFVNVSAFAPANNVPITFQLQLMESYSDEFVMLDVCMVINSTGSVIMNYRYEHDHNEETTLGWMITWFGGGPSPRVYVASTLRWESNASSLKATSIVFYVFLLSLPWEINV